MQSVLVPGMSSAYLTLLATRQVHLASLKAAERKQYVFELVKSKLDEQLGAGSYDAASPFMDMGIDSLGATAFQQSIQSAVGCLIVTCSDDADVSHCACRCRWVVV